MIIHVIREGETLTALSEKYSVSVARILSDNGILAPDSIVVGQAIVILQPDITYIIRRGETLAYIAGLYGVSAMSLLRNNPFLIGAPLPAGVEIAITLRGEKYGSLHTNGYAYPNIDYPTLEYALPFMNRLTVFGYGFTADGELIPTPDEVLIDYAKRYGVAPIMLLCTVTENGTFSSAHADVMMNDAAARTRLVDNILSVMEEKGYTGLDIDFEYISPHSADVYLDFIRYTAARLNARGYSVNTDLAPKTSANQRGLLYEAHNYGAIGEASDTVLLMTYEWGYKYSEPTSQDLRVRTKV